jgi:hypothetical protein
MRRRLSWAFGWVLVVAGGACLSDELGTGENEHTEGEYIQANHPLYWNASEYSQFRTITDRERWNPNPQPVASDDLATRWLQHWADQIDELVRAKVKADTGQELVAPKPIMHLLPSSSISNAWVTAVPACVPWQVRSTSAPSGGEGGSTGEGGGGTGGGGAQPASDEKPILFNHYGKKVQELGGGEASGCIPREDFAPFAETFLREWNQGTPDCPAQLTSDGVIEVAEKCMGSFEHASKSAMYAISPHIQFSSDLLAAGTEGGAVFVVGHELAHYYRAHGSPLARHKYGFWYDQDARTARRPVPSSDAKELERLYKEVEAMPRAIAAEIPGATHSKRFQRVVSSSICKYVSARSSEADFPEACGETKSLCEVVAPLAHAGRASDEQVDAYLALETELATCGAVERLGAVETPALGDLVRALQLDGYLPGGPAESVPLPQSFGALVTLVQKAAAEQDATVERFAEKLRLGRIGLYTTEQEADDLALEWTNKLGFDTHAAVDGWLTYLVYFARGYTPHGEPSPTECRELYESDFKDGRAFVTVWLGDLNSAHHAGCYRVYNLWREQRAHRYEPASSISRPDFATWDEVLAHAKELSRGY